MSMYFDDDTTDMSELVQESNKLTKENLESINRAFVMINIISLLTIQNRYENRTKLHDRLEMLGYLNNEEINYLNRAIDSCVLDKKHNKYLIDLINQYRRT